MNNTGQQQSNNDNNNSSNSNSNSQDHQNPGNGITNSNNMFSTAASANSNESVGAGQPFGSSDNSTAHFFQQQQQQQGADIGSMDDVQFSASLDALLNGDQLSSITGSSTGHAHTSSSGGNSGSTNCDSFSTQQQQQQQQQQQAMHVAQPYLVSAGAPGTAGGYAPQQHQASTGQTQQGQQQQQQQVQQLSGLPLASAHQGALQLVPQGPHSAAQMSLSAAHAAATGAFHPGNPSPMAALPQQQTVQAPFPWAITSNMVAPPTAAAPTAPMSVVASAPTMIGNMQQVSGSSSSIEGRRGKRTHDVSAVSVDGDQSKRRSDRNQREQQRSHKITEQIAELRDILSSANLQFKPDKYSTLTKVVEYIRQLQERSQLLDVEHKKLIESISETNEIVNNQYMPAYASGSDSPSISNDLLADGVSSSLEDESMVYVRGLDYKIAFQGCGIPLALSSIDGRFLDCNDTFLALTGYSREELLPLDEPGEKNTVSFSPNQDESSKKNLSLFNLLSRDGMEQVFSAMSEMLKHPGSIGTPETKPTDASRRADFWSGPVKLCHQDNRPVCVARKKCILTSFFFFCVNNVTHPLYCHASCSIITGQAQCDSCPYLAWATQVLQLRPDGAECRQCPAF